MLVCPLILTMMLLSCLYLIYSGITGIENVNSFKYENVFFEAIDSANTLAEKWIKKNDFDGIKADINRFNNRYKEKNITLLVYMGNDLLYPQSEKNNSVPENILLENDTYALISKSSSIYRISAGEYTIIMLDENLNISYNNTIGKRLYIGIFGILFLIFAIVFINRTLTRFVFRSIINPINTLVGGVHEIRDGNLSYRIQYNNNDEFADVCSDFNEMAVHLLNMVNARQKDETNRRELIAGISHDLRTPLTSVKAYLEGIEKGVASTPEAQKRYFDIIKSKTNDLEYIINQLFLFSKLDIGDFPFHLEVIDIGYELSCFVACHEKEYAEKGLKIINHSIEKIYTEIDIVQLRNVIYNILENSLKYKQEDIAVIKILCREDNGNVLITFTDNGPGVSEDALEKMFDVFYRSDTARNNPSKGSGLGLAISRKIIERLKGRIDAKNADGGGLEIRIMLPIIKYEESEG